MTDGGKVPDKTER